MLKLLHQGCTEMSLNMPLFSVLLGRRIADFAWFQIITHAHTSFDQNHISLRLVCSWVWQILTLQHRLHRVPTYSWEFWSLVCLPPSESSWDTWNANAGLTSRKWSWWAHFTDLYVTTAQSADTVTFNLTLWPVGVQSFFHRVLAAITL